MSDLSVRELQDLCQKFADLRDAKAELEDRVSELSKEIADTQALILEKFVEHEIPSLKGAWGTLSVNTVRTFKQPETIDEKLKLFEYLKEQDLYETMVKVDSRTLSSWASKEVEAKERDGILGFIPPGLSQPYETQKLSLRKGKS
jgi:hypothetical protein